MVFRGVVVYPSLSVRGYVHVNPAQKIPGSNGFLGPVRWPIVMALLPYPIKGFTGKNAKE